MAPLWYGKSTGWIVTKTGNVLYGISWLQRQATTECGKFPGEDLRETASQPLELLKL